MSRRESSPTDASHPASRWVAIVSADRGVYDRGGVTEVQFPLGVPERVVELAADEVTIGRRSARLGIDPTIDLAGPPEDSGVSHTHASLRRQPNDTWVLVDRGSSNGTFLNDTTEPLLPGTPVGLRHGDRFHIGVWTQIVIERRAAR